MANAVPATKTTDYSTLLVSELCEMLRGLELDALDCWSPSRMTRLRGERAELVAEMTARGLEVAA